MKDSSKIIQYAIVLACAVIIGFTLYTPILGGPGASDDPIVSLSYMEIASKFNEIPLRKNDELPIPSGSLFVLMEGQTELRGTGDYTMIDLTMGKKFKRGKDISESHLYIVTGGSDLKIAAKGDAKILMRASDAGPLRKAMTPSK